MAPTPESRVTCALQASVSASQASPGSVFSTPTPAVNTRAPKITNPPKIGGVFKPPSKATPEKAKRFSRKVVPSVLHGIEDYMSILPQDLVKELRQSTRKAQWEAVAVEFMRKCAWRLRHFSKEELRKIAVNVVPSMGPVTSVDQAVEFFSEIQRDIQSGIALAHELAARWFIGTPAGKEYLEYAKKTKKGKHAVRLVDVKVLEEALGITNMELMGFWTPIVSSAKSTYWEDSTGTRSMLLAMRRISYEIISKFIGAMKSWNGAEAELSFSVRQVILQSTSSLKSPAFWPDPPGPYPVGAAKWEATCVVVESPEDSPDFQLFMQRFQSQRKPHSISKRAQSQGDVEDADGPDADSEDIYAAPPTSTQVAPRTQSTRTQRVSGDLSGSLSSSTLGAETVSDNYENTEICY